MRATGEPGELDYHGGAVADNSALVQMETNATAVRRVVRLTSVAGVLRPESVSTPATSLGALTSVASGAAQAPLNVVAGTTYRIAVDGNGGSTGTFNLEWLLAECNGLNATIFGNGDTDHGHRGR